MQSSKVSPAGVWAPSLKSAGQQLETALKGALERAEKAEAYQRQLQKYLRSVCHELRTPLTAISGSYELLQGVYDQLKILSLDSVDYTPLLEELAEIIAMFEESSENMTRLINDVLDLEKLRAGKMELHKTHVDLKRMIHQLLKPLTLKLQEKKIIVHLDLDQVNQIVEIDKLRFGQVLGNLISNAIKFTKNGSITVRLSFQRSSTVNFMKEEKSTLPNDAGVCEIVGNPPEEKSDQPYLHCVVTNTGVAIEKERLSALFQPYVQESAAISHHSGGTGLGLSISKELVKLMGGEISVKSEKDKGTSFGFTIACKLMGPILTLNRKFSQDTQNSSKADMREESSLHRDSPIQAETPSSEKGVIRINSIGQTGPVALPGTPSSTSETSSTVVVLQGIQQNGQATSNLVQPVILTPAVPASQEVQATNTPQSSLIVSSLPTVSQSANKKTCWFSFCNTFVSCIEAIRDCKVFSNEVKVSPSGDYHQAQAPFRVRMHY